MFPKKKEVASCENIFGESFDVFVKKEVFGELMEMDIGREESVVMVSSN